MTFLIALGLLLASSTGASDAANADGASATTPAATSTAKSVKKPKKVCKADPSLTGTRIAKRICKTQAEWDEPADAQEVQSRSKGGLANN